MFNHDPRTPTTYVGTTAHAWSSPSGVAQPQPILLRVEPPCQRRSTLAAKARVCMPWKAVVRQGRGRLCAGSSCTMCNAERGSKPFLWPVVNVSVGEDVHGMQYKNATARGGFTFTNFAT